MIKHLLKIIWSQRKSNGWIFAELTIVACAVWWMSDQLYVDMHTYYSPMGYDISDTWRFQLDLFNRDANEYISEEQYTSSGSEDLQKLQQQIKQQPEVEDVCISFYSAPYSFGNSWTSIEPIDGDTTLRGQSFQCRYVSPEYFEMFRITDIHGNTILPQLKDTYNPVIVSEDMAIKFFHTNDVRNRQIKYADKDSERMTIAAVSVPYRNNSFSRSEAFFYKLITTENINNYFSGSMAKNAEFCVRMKNHYSLEEMNHLLQQMGDRLIVHNLYVYSANPTDYYRDIQISGTVQKQKQKLSMMLFLLVNVLFGITGTFWLRGQARRAEVGLRIALGANKYNIQYFMYMEGLLLLLLTIPLMLIFALNMCYMDVLDSYRLPYSIGRFLFSFSGTYLLLAGMICLGIRFPVRKAGKIAPAEALHYE